VFPWRNALVLLLAYCLVLLAAVTAVRIYIYRERHVRYRRKK
jgi:hypothetical protein